MKTPSIFLYDLVHRLTKSEKRYLKVQAGSVEKDYINLMDALLAQKKFDEELLIKNNKNANFIKHLAVNKRYLYELILKSLAHFGQKKEETKVLEKISAANVLIEKGLFTAALNELKKGHKIAEQYELFELQIILCGIEKKLLTKKKFKTNEDNTLFEIYTIETNSLEQLKNTNEYWYLTHQIAQFQTRFQKIETAEHQQFIDELINSPKFQNKDLASNFKSKLYFYQANAIYQFMIGEVAKANEINTLFLDFLEENPRFLRIYTERYIATLNNILIDSVVMGKYELLEEGINRLVQIPNRAEFKNLDNIESRVFRQQYLLLLNWSLRQKDFKKAKEWIPKIEEGLEKFGKKIEKHHRITFYYLTAYILFLNKDYDEALSWNNEIIYSRKEDVVKEIFYFARILNLLIHYELGNTKLLESLLLSTPKYLKRRRNIYETEKVLFRFLGKMLFAYSKKEQQQLKQDFKNQIVILSEKPKEKRVFSYIDLKLWIG